MSDILSQEEIDALLKGNGKENLKKNQWLDEENDVFLELCNIFIKEVENFMLAHVKERVSVTTSNVSFVEKEEIEDADKLLAFSTSYSGKLQEKIFFVFDLEPVKLISNSLVGGNVSSDENNQTPNDIFLSSMRDVLPVATKEVAKVLNCNVEFSDMEVLSAKDLDFSKKMIKVTYLFEVENVVKSSFYKYVPFSTAKEIVSLLMNAVNGNETDENNDVKKEKINVSIDENSYAKKQKRKEKTSPVKVQSISYPSFDDDPDPVYEENLDFILDVPLKITVELGSTTKPIKDILNTNVGSIVELDNLTEDYVDVLVNGKLIARGEVVVVDENFGVRIMELFTNERQNLFNKE